MSRYVMAQAGMLLTLFAFTPIPAHAQEVRRTQPGDVPEAQRDTGASRLGRARPQREAAAAQAPEEIAAVATQALTAASVSCQVTNAREIGRLPDGSSSVLEAACATGPGYVLTTATPPVVFNCLIAANQADDAVAANPEATPPRCELPENADVLAAVQPWVQAAGLSCQVDQVQWVGRTGNGSDRYEVGCNGAGGAWIEIGQDGSVTNTLDCLQIPANAGACEYTTAAESAAGIQARLAGSPAADCAASQARYMGANQNGRFFELKCASGVGQVVRLGNDGAFQQAYDCAQAANIGDGCQLSDAGAAVAAQGEQRAARLAELGRPCTVTDQRVIGREGDGAQREVVEFGCSDAPLGLVALFAAEGAQGSEAIDCLTAKGRSLTCQFTTEDQIKGVLGQMLQASNRACDVSDYRIAGLMAEGDGQVIEVKCASGSGFLGEFPATRTAAGQIQTCTQAAQVGDRCEL